MTRKRMASEVVVQENLQVPWRRGAWVRKIGSLCPALALWLGWGLAYGAPRPLPDTQEAKVAVRIMQRGAFQRPLDFVGNQLPNAQENEALEGKR
jgi:hypothetical protein